MRIRCAWHKPPKIIGEKEPLEDMSITDGICDDCIAKHFPNVADKIHKLEIAEQDRYTNFKIGGTK